MSSLPKTPQDIKDLIAERERYLSAERKAIDKREALSEPEEIPQLMATLALARSAGADIGTPMAPQPHLIVTTAGVSIERDGCDFIGATQVFLDYLDCPVEARDFVLTLMGLSGGNYNDLLVITDDDLAKRTGLSRPTIKAKRDSLMDWEQAMNHTIVEIIQREYDYALKKTKPTQYRIIITPYIAKFIRRARADSSISRNPGRPTLPIEHATLQGVKELVVEIAEDLPHAEIIKRTNQRIKERNLMPMSKPFDRMKGLEETILRSVNDWVSEAFQRGYELDEVWPRFDGRIQDVVKERFRVGRSA